MTKTLILDSVILFGFPYKSFILFTAFFKIVSANSLILFSHAPTGFR